MNWSKTWYGRLTIGPFFLAGAFLFIVFFPAIALAAAGLRGVIAAGTWVLTGKLEG